ncbi:MAG TPA: hypothetical protein VGA16_11705 [Candidatus Limnocylindria bacterium]
MAKDEKDLGRQGDMGEKQHEPGKPGEVGKQGGDIGKQGGMPEKKKEWEKDKPTEPTA